LKITSPAQPVTGAQLLEIGSARSAARRAVVRDQSSISHGKTAFPCRQGGVLSADAVILATGAARKAPALSGLLEWRARV
jgi:hypothetical protein